MKFETTVQLLCVGSLPDGAFAPVVARSVATRTADIGELARSYGSGEDYFYYRFGNNPTIMHAEALVARLVGMDKAMLFSSGMAAVSAAILTAISSGVRHAIVQDQVFDQTARLFDVLHRWGLLDVRFLHPLQIERGDWSAPDVPVLVYLESPSNPMLAVTDVSCAVSHVRKHHRSSLVVVDSTVGSPGVQDLSTTDVDMIVHSATKSLAGHNDLMAGVVAARASLLPRLGEVRRLFGAVPSVDDAWLLARSLKTLPLRVSQMCGSAEQLARYLAQHPAVAKVWYPFIGDDHTTRVACRQMTRGGALLSFSLKGGRSAARQFCDALKVIRIATSLGGTATVVEIPRELDWSGETPVGIPGVRVVPEDLIRLSVGLENTEDLLADIGQVLALLLPEEPCALPVSSGVGI